MSEATEPLELKVISDGFELANKRMQETAAISKQLEGTAATLQSKVAVSSARLTEHGHAAREAATGLQAMEKAAVSAGGMGGAGLSMFEKATVRLGESMQEGGHEAVAFGAKLALGWASFEGAKHVIEETIHATVEYQSIIARLEGITGSTEDAKEKFEELEAVSKKTIFTEDQLANAFIHLKQVGLDPTDESLKAFSNMASAFGTDVGSISQAVVMASMGMYRSLRQYGISAEEDGNKLKVTFRGQTETINKTAESVQAYFTKLGNNQFAGAAARQLDTMGGSLKELSEAWEHLYRNIGNSVIGDIIKTSIGDAAWVIDGLGKSIEALLFTISKKPPGMSKEKRDVLDHFMDGKWGEEEESQAETIADKIRDIHEKAQSKEDVALRTHLANRKAILAASTDEEFQAAYDFDARAALAEEDAAYAKIAGGDKKDKKPKGDTGEAFDKGMRKLSADNRKAFLDDLDAKLEANDKELEGIKKTLKGEEDAIRESYEKRKEVLNDYNDEGGVLRKKNEDQWAAHMDEVAQQKHGAARDKTNKHADLMSPAMTDVERIRDDERRKLEAAQEARDEDLVSEAEHEKLKVEIHKQANIQIRESDAALMQQSTQNAEMIFANLAEASKRSGAKQSDVYKTLFAAQKAFAVASAGVSMAVGMGKAMELGWPAGIPAGLAAAAEGAKIIAMISAANYSGAHDLGGRIPAGSIGLVGERGPELVRGPADVTSRADTAKMMGGGSPNITVNASFDPHEAVNRYLSSTQGVRTVNIHLQKNHRTIQALGNR